MITSYLPRAKIEHHSSFITFLSIIIIALSLPPYDGVYAQCSPYLGPSLKNTGQICPPFVTPEVYGNGLVQFFSDALSVPILGTISGLGPILPSRCYASIAALLCQSIFPACHTEYVYNTTTNNDNVRTIVMASPPCRSRCERTLEECKDVIDLIGNGFLNCSATSFSGGTGPQWPVEDAFMMNVTFPATTANNVSLPAYTISMPAPCTSSSYRSSNYTFHPPSNNNNNNIDGGAGDAGQKCPYPLVNTRNSSEDAFPCFWPCPDRVYSAQEYYSLNLAAFVPAIFSVILSFFLLLSYVLNPARRRFPSRLQAYVFICTALACSTYTYGGLYPMGRGSDGSPELGVGNTLWCSSPIKYNSQDESALCGFQGFMFVQFSLGIVYWWLIIVFNLYLGITYDKKIDSKRFEKYYHIIGWGLPLLFNIVMFSIGKFTAGPPAGMCFLHSFNNQNVNDNASDVQWFVFYLPLAVPLIIALLLLGRIIWTLMYYSRANKREFIRPNLRGGGGGGRYSYGGGSDHYSSGGSGSIEINEEEDGESSGGGGGGGDATTATTTNITTDNRETTSVGITHDDDDNKDTMMMVEMDNTSSWVNGDVSNPPN
eukprot:TRINITY_DN3105_c0_g2_i1.p1 TRINITY_DN3105_c0_g2~~TRINITY_DN3105_c0_g2_i1.p1  ORF type:complete len:599 (+),score=109.89 TRINITY_DN3105_c0_g2_i1:73-1869(+)